MDNNQTNRNINKSGNRALAGIFILGFGILLLLYKMNFPIPHFLFEWPAIAIIIGLYVGIKSRFQNFAWFVAVLIGGIFLFGDLTDNTELHNYIMPIIFITIGAIFILRPKKWKHKNDQSAWMWHEKNYQGKDVPKYNADINETDAEFLDINAVFGGGKKIILSKNFKGGEINCFMGGAEINLLQADIQHPVKLEINNVFGGTKIVVPSNWDVKNEMTAVFGGIDDKRSFANVQPDANKTLIIEGNCFFGGIEIRNF